MNIVKSTNLREKASECFIVLATVTDGSSPIISPFNHSAWLQNVVADFVDIRTLPTFDLMKIKSLHHISYYYLTIYNEQFT